MAGRTPAEAVRAFLDPLQQAVSCVTRAPLQVSRGGRKVAEQPHTLFWNQRQPVLLKVAQGYRIGLSLFMWYEIIRTDTDRGPWKVRTAGYMYTVQSEAGDEVFSYHWHPQGESPVTYPHLHMGHVKLDPDGMLLQKAHLPGGRVSVESIVRLLIQDFGVIPLREDWESVLDSGEETFTRWRTWH